MRNSSVPGSDTRSKGHSTGEWSDFVELARRMSVPADVAIHEFMDRGMRLGPAAREAAAELAVVDG
jgi:hypothetical protein